MPVLVIAPDQRQIISSAMRRTYGLIERVAPTDTTVLLYGETGTGKELAAETIHHLSLRANNPLIRVNCAALSESLLESELFGHVKGAFTGATHERAGRFEAAQGGTLFLDEIGEISHATQVRLLRVLESKSIERVGSSQPVKLNVRLIFATNRNLAREVATGSFRADLFFRLNIVKITLPPLRERLEAIPALAEHFIRLFNEKSGGHRIIGISAEAIDVLSSRSWPGNVRELRNAIEKACVFCDGDLLKPEDLGSHEETIFWDGQERRKGNDRRSLSNVLDENPDEPIRASSLLTTARLLETLEKHRWHLGRTANALGIHRSTLWRHMQRLNLLPIANNAS